MNTASLTETAARDCLYRFLVSRNRAPLRELLKLYLGDPLPGAFQNVDAVELLAEEVAHHLEFDGKRSSTARTDLVLKSDRHVVVIEVKVNAEESLHQYAKYKTAYEDRGYQTIVVGLIKRIKISPRIKDHEGFLKQYKRVLWSELLAHFASQFRNAPEYQVFESELIELDPRIGAYARPQQKAVMANSVDLLGSSSDTLFGLYQDFDKRIPDFKCKPFQAGSTGCELHIGRLAWADDLQEPFYQRISLALNPFSPQIDRLHQEPYFAFCILLWNRSYFKNPETSLPNSGSLAKYFHNRGFDVVRNRKGWTGGNITWEPPFNVDPRMCFANAFWEHRFSLPKSKFIRMSWQELLRTLEAEFQQLANMMEAVCKRMKQR